MKCPYLTIAGVRIVGLDCKVQSALPSDILIIIIIKNL